MAISMFSGAHILINHIRTSLHLELSSAFSLAMSLILKVYKVFDPIYRRIFISKDVIFHEDSFPYKAAPTKDTEVFFPIPIDDQNQIPIPISKNNLPETTFQLSLAQLPIQSLVTIPLRKQQSHFQAKMAGRFCFIYI